jgi:hypothetical protein
MTFQMTSKHLLILLGVPAKRSNAALPFHSASGAFSPSRDRLIQWSTYVQYRVRLHLAPIEANNVIMSKGMLK